MRITKDVIQKFTRSSQHRNALLTRSPAPLPTTSLCSKTLVGSNPIHGRIRCFSNCQYTITNTNVILDPMSVLPPVTVSMMRGFASSTVPTNGAVGLAVNNVEQHNHRNSDEDTNDNHKTNHKSNSMNDNHNDNSQSRTPSTVTTGSNRTHHHPRLKPKPNPKSKPSLSLGLHRRTWVAVTGIPPLSTLDDLLPDLERIFSVELERGIVDLDKVNEETLLSTVGDSTGTTEEETSLPLWIPRLLVDTASVGSSTRTTTNDDDNDPSSASSSPTTSTPLPPHLVLEAQTMVSSSGRPRGWFLRFPNRSVVHALLQHVSEARRAARRRRSARMTEETKDVWDEGGSMTRPWMCGWKEVEVRAFRPGPPVVKRKKGKTDHRKNGRYSKEEILRHQFGTGKQWGLGENVVRVENCPEGTEVEDLRYLFGRYGLWDTRGRSTKRKDDERTKKNEYEREWNDVEHFATRTVQRTPSTTLERVLNRSRSNPTTIARRSVKETVSTFLLRFEDAAGARAAVREKQNVELRGGNLLLSRYSRQIL